ncbi:hypothetical protein KJ855_02300 [Patescibacteria group bacterium]|nr:hypothetical protein [Patescibacteria group bacterium]
MNDNFSEKIRGRSLDERKVLQSKLTRVKKQLNGAKTEMENIKREMEENQEGLEYSERKQRLEEWRTKIFQKSQKIESLENASYILKLEMAKYAMTGNESDEYERLVYSGEYLIEDLRKGK